MASDHMEIELTDAACERVRTLLNEAGKNAIRLSLKEAGCSGLEYVFDFADEPGKDDLQVRFEGFTLLVDADDYEKALKGVRIDYQQDLLSAAFVFENPNKTGECGCGKSFTI